MLGIYIKILYRKERKQQKSQAAFQPAYFNNLDKAPAFLNNFNQ